MIEIQWFYAEPGAKVFPSWHRFGSGNWAYEDLDWRGVGEVLGAPRLKGGSGPGHMAGQNFVGTLEHFQQGALRAERGLELNALCFPGEVIGADGGAILGFGKEPPPAPTDACKAAEAGELLAGHEGGRADADPDQLGAGEGGRASDQGEISLADAGGRAAADGELQAAGRTGSRGDAAGEVMPLADGGRVGDAGELEGGSEGAIAGAAGELPGLTAIGGRAQDLGDVVEGNAGGIGIADNAAADPAGDEGGLGGEVGAITDGAEGGRGGDSDASTSTEDGLAIGEGLGEMDWWHALFPDGAAIGEGLGEMDWWHSLFPDGGAGGSGD